MPEPWIKHPTVLNGRLVDLIPMELMHFDELIKVAADKRIWEFYVGDWSAPAKFTEALMSFLTE